MWSDASDGAGLRDSSYTTGHYSASSEAPPVPSVDLATHSRKTSTTRPVSLTQDEGPASQQLSANPTSDKIDDAERLRTPGADGSLQEQQQTTKSEDLEAPKDSLAAPKPSTTTTAGSADHRASVDSFTQNAMLANRFESSD